MKKITLYLGLALLYACSSKSQETNFKELFSLNKKHREVSGLVYDQSSQKLWMLQDKGNPAELLVYNVNGTFERTLKIAHEKNTDWEDLSKDVQGNLYIGNFGNNDNKRKNLRILKIDQNNLHKKEAEASQTTQFYYEDQKDFPPKKGNLMYDCEAFVATDDAFYLFSKNRSKGFDGTFYVYKVPNKPGTFKAKKIATLKSCSQYKTCAITGAALNKSGTEIALIAHDYVFLIPFKDDYSFTQENMQIVELNHHSQKESITYKNNKELFIADEKEKGKVGGNIYILGLD